MCLSGMLVPRRLPGSTGARSDSRGARVECGGDIRRPARRPGDHPRLVTSTPRSHCGNTVGHNTASCSSREWHFVFASARSIMIKVNLTEPISQGALADHRVQYLPYPAHLDDPRWLRPSGTAKEKAGT